MSVQYSRLADEAVFKGRLDVHAFHAEHDQVELVNALLDQWGYSEDGRETVLDAMTGLMRRETPMQTA